MKLIKRQKTKKEQAWDAVASVAGHWSDWHLKKRASTSVAKGAGKVSAMSGAAKSTPAKLIGGLALAGGIGAAVAKRFKRSDPEPIYSPPISAPPPAPPMAAPAAIADPVEVPRIVADPPPSPIAPVDEAPPLQVAPEPEAAAAGDPVAAEALEELVVEEVPVAGSEPSEPGEPEQSDQAVASGDAEQSEETEQPQRSEPYKWSGM